MKYRSGTQLSPRPLDVRLAARQHGVFSRAQAFREGATQRVIHNRLATGRWERLHPSVYRLAGVARSWRQEVAAACLAAGPGAVASHRAAAVLWQFPDVVQRLIEISVPRRRVRLRGVIVHEVAYLPSIDVSTIEGIPVTSATRTVVDLAAVISRDMLEEALDDALRRGLTTIPRLRWRTKERADRGGGRRAFAGYSRLGKRETPTLKAFSRRVFFGS